MNQDRAAATAVEYGLLVPGATGLPMPLSRSEVEVLKRRFGDEAQVFRRTVTYSDWEPADV